MNKLQIQLPGPLYRKLKRVAKQLDYSLAELMRRGAEHIVMLYPHLAEEVVLEKWNLPEPRSLGLKETDPRKLRELAHDRS